MDNSYLTLDLATMSGFCLWKPGSKPTVGIMDLKTWFTDNYQKALSVHYNRINRLVVENDVNIICFEAPMIVRRGAKTTSTKNARKLIGLANIVELICGQYGIACYEAEVSQWRKHVLGHGQLSTDVAKDKAMKVAKGCGLNPPTHDAAEAFCIMDYCADIQHEKKDWKDPVNFRWKL